MPSFESKKENYVDLMKENISVAREGIKEEFARTANSWLACFAGHLDVVDTYLSLAKKAGQLSETDYAVLDTKIEALKLKVHNLRDTYPEKGTMPPESLQEELLHEMDVFA